MDQILFYSPKERPYGPFSNFSRHPVRYMDLDWLTSEHSFQAMKFWPHRPDLVERVRLAPGPMEAALLGRDRTLPLREDWDNQIGLIGLVDDGRGPAPVIERVKDQIMFEVVLAKFGRHEGLKSILLGTGDLPIIENAIHDPYWGWGSSRTGVNRLGKILMYVRQELRLGVKPLI
jgi:N-glycosidase YbiA